MGRQTTFRTAGAAANVVSIVGRAGGVKLALED
jgi:hypothetical protein